MNYLPPLANYRIVTALWFYFNSWVSLAQIHTQNSPKPHQFLPLKKKNQPVSSLKSSASGLRALIEPHIDPTIRSVALHLNGDRLCFPASDVRVSRDDVHDWFCPFSPLLLFLFPHFHLRFCPSTFHQLRWRAQTRERNASSIAGFVVLLIGAEV